MVTKDAIINAINGVLSDVDVADIQQVINQRRKVPVEPVELANQGWLLDGFVHLFISRGLLTGNFADSRIPKSDAYKIWTRKLPKVMAWLEQLEKTQGLNPDNRPQLAFLCAQALALHLEAMDLFGVSTMLSQVDRIPEALDQAFPGYIAAKLFGMVIRTKRI